MIPTALSRYFADSSLSFYSYTEEGSVLAIRIEKEIGPEVGVIRFREVSYIQLPITVPGETIHAHSIRAMDTSFWSRTQLDEREFEGDEIVFEIESQDGPAYYVVAKSVSYEVSR